MLEHVDGHRGASPLLDDAPQIEALVDLFCEDELKPDAEGRVTLALDPYGYRWFRGRRAS